MLKAKHIFNYEKQRKGIESNITLVWDKKSNISFSYTGISVSADALE